MYSFQSVDEFQEVKKDMEQAFHAYSMDLKYLITSQKHDPEVLKHPKRGNTRIERTLGVLWDVVDDTIIALPKYNLYGTSRGKPLGPDLIEMDDELIMKLKITRLLFLRLSAQTYCRLGNLIGPLITCIKALSSRACEIAGVHELELDLEERDPAFVYWSRIFIKNLKHIKEILPFRRSWVPENHHLLGFLVYSDGGKIGLGTAIYALSSKNDDTVEKALCIANGRLSKRNIVAHEVLVG